MGSKNNQFLMANPTPIFLKRLEKKPGETNLKNLAQNSLGNNPGFPGSSLVQPPWLALNWEPPGGFLGNFLGKPKVHKENGPGNSQGVP